MSFSTRTTTTTPSTKVSRSEAAVKSVSAIANYTGGVSKFPEKDGTYAPVGIYGFTYTVTRVDGSQESFNSNAKKAVYVNDRGDGGETDGVETALRMIAAGKALLADTLANLSPAGRAKFSHLLGATVPTAFTNPTPVAPTPVAPSTTAADLARLAAMADMSADVPEVTF